MDEHEARQQAYDAAVKARDELIDNPEKHLPVGQYRAHLKDAQKTVNRTYKALAAARG